MFSTDTQLGRIIAAGSATLSLLLLAACGRDRLSLPVAQAASSTAAMTAEAVSAPEPYTRPVRRVDDALLAKSLAEFEKTTTEMYRDLPSRSCYSYMLHRPQAQRDLAVQARLRQADKMSAALDSDTFNVDLVGDHANVLSLEFPVEWPGSPGYSQKVSSVIVSYLSAPEIQDYLCNSGFSEVKFSAHGTNDGRSHLLWTARVTNEGLMRQTAGGRRERLDDLVAQQELPTAREDR